MATNKNDGRIHCGHHFLYTYADRIYTAVFSCSVNLIVGKANVEADDVERIKLRTAERDYPLREHVWEDAPKACEGLRKYDDAFLEKHFGDVR